jgi:hypothetical protein
MDVNGYMSEGGVIDSDAMQKIAEMMESSDSSNLAPADGWGTTPQQTPPISQQAQVMPIQGGDGEWGTASSSSTQGGGGGDVAQGRFTPSSIKY